MKSKLTKEEDVASLLYDLVWSRVPNKKIVEKLMEESNLLLGINDTEYLEEVVKGYNSSRKGLEEAANKIFKVLKKKEKEDEDFKLDFLNFDSGWKVK